MKTDIEDWSNDAENSALLSQKKKWNWKIIYFVIII